eukprot:TRINITY_DN10637_c0_g1_i1.p2 TRINITY_DN10637_c0_g1~~TRINITY_DN10637_c0_g1_i1.p2  ORF type:complete len:126 (+),score=25.77 TRINITY_DN10637_c0_g1_i1:64-441(+)
MCIRDRDRYDVESRNTDDPICAISAQEGLLVVGRSKGSVHKYNLPVVSLESKVFLNCTPQLMGLNCNSTRLSVVDVNGILTFWEFTAQGFTQLNFEKRDVWEMKWADDDPLQFCLLYTSPSPRDS